MKGVDGFLNFINTELSLKEVGIFLRDPIGNDGFTIKSKGFVLPPRFLPLERMEDPFGHKGNALGPKIL